MVIDGRNEIKKKNYARERNKRDTNKEASPTMVPSHL